MNKLISPQVLHQMDTLAKTVSQPSVVSKAIDYSMFKQPELDRISNAISQFPFNEAVKEINRLQKALEGITLDQVANKLAYSSITAITALNDRIPVLLEFAQTLPYVYRIFSNSLFLENSIAIATEKLKNNFDVISSLQNIKFNFPSILINQQESFLTVPYIKKRQKTVILKAEQEQNNNLLLGTDDIDNADCINTTIQTSIALVDQISHNPEPISISDIGLFNREYDLKEALCQINPSFYKKLLGAEQSANSDNVEKTRHISISLRELLKDFINTIIPTYEVKNYYGGKINGNPSLEQKINYFFKDITYSQLTELVKNDVILIKQITGVLNTCVHDDVDFPDEQSLFFLVNKVKSILMMLLNYNLHRKPDQEPPHA
ncbi:pPIWI-associating nuclease domain-containing protein [Treponema sp. R80B11-R83G3]